MFEEIETRRAKAGIDQAELCRRAGIHPTSYTARKSGRRAMRETTLASLKQALDMLIRERGQDMDEARAAG